MRSSTGSAIRHELGASRGQSHMKFVLSPSMTSKELSISPQGGFFPALVSEYTFCLLGLKYKRRPAAYDNAPGQVPTGHKSHGGVTGSHCSWALLPHSTKNHRGGSPTYHQHTGQAIVASSFLPPPLPSATEATPVRRMAEGSTAAEQACAAGAEVAWAAF